jgi:hypothetical protein
MFPTFLGLLEPFQKEDFHLLGHHFSTTLVSVESYCFQGCETRRIPSAKLHSGNSLGNSRTVEALISYNTCVVKSIVRKIRGKSTTINERSVSRTIYGANSIRKK